MVLKPISQDRYMDHGIECNNALSKVDLRKGPLERTVRSIVRLKPIDYNSRSMKGKNLFTMKRTGLLTTG